MRTTKMAIYGVIGLLVLVSVVVLTVAGTAKAERRTLTDGEMAGLFGRQPAPAKCPGCYLKEINLECEYDDPCACVTQAANPKCVNYSEETYDFTTGSFPREKEEGDKANDQQVTGYQRECYDPYFCVAGTEVAQAKCDAKGKCTQAINTSCLPCSRGTGPFPPSPITDYKCVDCKK